MDSGVEEPLAPALGALAVAGILGDVGDQAGIENALPIVRRIKAAIEIQIGTSEVQPDLFGAPGVSAGKFTIGLLEPWDDVKRQSVEILAQVLLTTNDATRYCSY